jgi:hypothetical protein
MNIENLLSQGGSMRKISNLRPSNCFPGCSRGVRVGVNGLMINVDFSRLMLRCCLLALLCLLTGCPQRAGTEAGKSAVGSTGRSVNPSERRTASEFPPLKIGLVDCPSLEAELSDRWASVSEQPLEIIKIERGVVRSASETPIDVLIYPGSLLGTIHALECIAPLPKPLQQRIEFGSKSAVASGGEDRGTGLGFDEETRSAWPSRWHAISKLGKQTMGIPLGAPSWAIATRGADMGSLKELHRALVSGQSTSELAVGQWEKFLESAEIRFADRLEKNREALRALLAQRDSIDRRAVVSRYLLIMSTTESRYRGLFDLYKMVSRLNLPEFSRNAKVLERLAVLEPSTIFVSPTEAWEGVATGSAWMGIGWPRTDGVQGTQVEMQAGEFALSPLIWNGADGLVVSLGRKTRQSANAAEWIAWFTTEENRIALQQQSSLVELLELDDDRNRVREDYREYQLLQRMEASSVSLELTPRFWRADDLLEPLADALLDTLADPSVAEERFLRCKQEWDVLIEKYGRDKLRASVESTIGLSK